MAVPAFSPTWNTSRQLHEALRTNLCSSELLPCQLNVPQAWGWLPSHLVARMRHPWARASPSSPFLLSYPRNRLKGNGCIYFVVDHRPKYFMAYFRSMELSLPRADWFNG